MLGLRTTIAMVPDLQQAKSWYAQAFETEPYFDEPFYVGFNIGGYELGLQPTESENQVGQNVKTYWGIASESELRQQFGRLIEIGALAHEEPENVGGPIVVASVKDPWGNVIGLIFNPEFKASQD